VFVFSVLKQLLCYVDEFCDLKQLYDDIMFHCIDFTVLNIVISQDLLG